MLQKGARHLWKHLPAGDWKAVSERGAASIDYESLQQRWVTVPYSADERARTDELTELSDDELLKRWLAVRRELTTGQQYSHRGWYHELYSNAFRNKKIVDVGCGFAVDTLTFAEAGAHVTFVDLVQSNLEVVRRLAGMLRIDTAQFVHLEDASSLERLEADYDAIVCLGSFHHAPHEMMRAEAQELLKHLKPDGRWVQLAYPRERWVREGKLPFRKWGERTDGPGTPWCEWYDVPKLMELLKPAEFEVVLYQEFHGSTFNWFDLKRKG